MCGGLVPLALALFVGLAGPLFAAAEDADLLRTWERAFVIVPGEAGLVRGWIEDIDERLAETSPPLPTVIYLHGCAGLGRISHDAAKLLAEAGYAVIMPDSFAREHKPKSCDPARLVGGFHRGVLGWRQAEANQAIRKARRLAWVDADNVFLWGFSEGGTTAATVTGEPVNARIVEGWTCHAGWGEYRGLRAPDAEPVLALLGDEDPWFRPAYLRGDCGAFMEGRGNRESIVYERPDFLATKHHLSWHPEVQQLILDFLAEHRRTHGAVARDVIGSRAANEEWGDGSIASNVTVPFRMRSAASCTSSVGFSAPERNQIVSAMHTTHAGS